MFWYLYIFPNYKSVEGANIYYLLKVGRGGCVNRKRQQKINRIWVKLGKTNDERKYQMKKNEEED